MSSKDDPKVFSCSKYSGLISWPELRYMSAHKLHDFAWSELGKSLLYMDFMNADIEWGDQRIRVHDLCRKLVKEGFKRRFPNSIKNRKWFRKFLSDIANEIENQC